MIYKFTATEAYVGEKKTWLLLAWRLWIIGGAFP